MKQMLSKAIAFATEKHDGQFDKSGLPYILHVLKVMHYLKTEDEELMCIAVLHDVLEDCFFSDVDEGVSSLQNIGMSERVIKGVLDMTRLSDEDYEKYVNNLIKNSDAIKVKCAIFAIIWIFDA